LVRTGRTEMTAKNLATVKTIEPPDCQVVT
jgi:hypothetical protein